MAIPVVATQDATSIASTKATLNANLTYTSGLLTSRRFKWGSTTEMTNTELVGSTTATGTYSFEITGLTPNTTYYFQAVAINEDGTGTGSRFSFKTLERKTPSVTTKSAISVSHNAAIIRGDLTSTGGMSTTRYFRWGTTTAMTSSANKGATTSTGVYQHALSGLSPNTTYYFEAYATNADGSNYGGRLEFKTGSAPVEAPTVTTDTASPIGKTTATVSGTVTNTGGENPTRYIRWGPTTSMTNVINCGVGTGSFSTNLTGLSPDTTYYFEAYATNSGGSGYGGRSSFKTNADVVISAPTVSTVSATSVTTSSAILAGNISSTGGENPTRYIRWGTSSSNMPNTINVGTGGTGTYSKNVTGFSPATTYYFQAYATNSGGTGYGSTLSFTTRPASWSWTSTERDAFNNKGPTTTLTASRWNSFVANINAVRDWKGLSPISATAGTLITAAVFNTANQGIGEMKSTGIPTVVKGDIVYGSYFITLESTLNSV